MGLSLQKFSIKRDGGLEFSHKKETLAKQEVTMKKRVSLIFTLINPFSMLSFSLCYMCVICTVFYQYSLCFTGRTYGLLNIKSY